MRSRTKRDLTDAQVDAMIAEAFGDDARVTARAELTDGMFNAAWRLTLCDVESVRDVVLKVSPPPHVPLLTHEQDIMKTEAMFYHRAAGRAPLPTLLYAGFSRSIVDSDFLVLSALGGVAWRHAKALAAADRRALREELGRIVAGLHAIVGQRFGYGDGSGPLASSWPEVFAAMFDAVLADALRFGVDPPVAVERLRALPARHADALAEVVTPVLVHFDLWDGNILVDPSRPRIEGLIDAERAFWGDPHADFVSLALFGDIEADDAFLAGYRCAGGVARFTPGLRRRLALYRVYLYLIMIVEGAPRGYTGAGHRLARRYFAHKLRAALRALEGG